MSFLAQPNLGVTQNIEPRCPVFGRCGGCAYQDIGYEDELKIKESKLRDLFFAQLDEEDVLIEPIVASPQSYHYRHRLDVGIYRYASGEIVMGFMKEGRYNVVPIESCVIAREGISDFLPELKKKAREILPAKYRNANLVVRTSDDGRIVWGGIGRRSLRMDEKDYLWTQVNGKKIFFAMETFFQANLSILNSLIGKIRQLPIFGPGVVFFDLYAGVGLFGVSLADLVEEVVMVEDNTTSARLAEYNIRHQNLSQKAKIIQTRVENYLNDLSLRPGKGKNVAMIDPPRKGLRPEVIHALSENRSTGKGKNFDALLYLSCSPESLVRDLEMFRQFEWTIEKIMPFDFFPKTQHLETLVLLKPSKAHGQ